jgi:phage anti-repressor protein
MLLTPNTRSFCAFSVDADQLVFKIEELKYKPNTYYLFNTQVPHTVYNFETTRYLLSVEFAKDRDELSFNDLLKDIQTNYE